MANKIVLKKSSVAGKVPLATDLDVGELAVNLADAKLYSKDAGGTVIAVGGGGSGSGDVVGPSSSTDNALVRFDGTTGKLIQNSTATLDDSGNFAGVNAIGFDITPATLPTAIGTMYWDEGNQTPSINLNADVTLQMGQESVALVYNGTGSTIGNGKVVAVAGAQGQRPSVVLADADSEGYSASTLGIASQDILNGAEGFIATFGLVRGIDTSAFTAGQPIWLSQTAGQFTATRPSAPAHSVFLGWIIKVSASAGELFVNISNGWELDELHNVLISSPTSGNTLIYDASAGVWKNANITAGTGIGVSNGAGSITISNSGVTSVTGTSPVASSGGTTPDISLSSGYGDTQNPYASKTANYVLAAPNGTAGVPTFRAIVAADVPTLNQNTTGTAAGLSSTLVVGSGGTGQTSLTANNVILGNGASAVQFVAPGTSGNVLTSDGTTWTSAAAGASLSGQTDSASPYETALGYQAGNVNTGTNNTFIGYQAGLVNTTGANNTAVGYQAGYSNTTGTNGVFIGYNAGYKNTTNPIVAVGYRAAYNSTGPNNTVIGTNALYSNTTGQANTAIGDVALYSNSTGLSNTAVGYSALYYSNADRNTGIGSLALYSNTTGTNNTAVGVTAGRSISTGQQNTLLGANAGYSGTNNLTTGSNNILIGYNAAASSATVSNENTFGNSSTTSNRFWGDLKMGGSSAGTSGQVLTSAGSGSSPTWTTPAASLTGQTDSATPFETSLGYQAGNVSTGVDNTFVGYQAGLVNTTGTDNTAVGYNSLLANATGYDNTAIGSFTLDSNTSGFGNTAVGRSALAANNTGYYNVAIGMSAMQSNTTGNGNIAMGYRAMAASSTLSHNIAIGYNALTANTVGTLNTAVGSFALAANTTSNYNTAVGYNALTANTTGERNTAVGARALLANTTSNYNTAVGYNTLSANTTGNSNTAMGAPALSVNTTGGNNSAFGLLALNSNTTGGNNTALGYLALNSNTTNNNNTAVGRSAGAFVTGANNTLLGFGAGGNGIVNLTTGANNTLLGYSTQPSSSTVSNEITLGNSSIATLRCQVTTITALSDARDKTDVAELKAGLGFVNALKPVSFNWNMRDGGKVNVPDTGFIAQELQEVQVKTGVRIPGLVYDENPERLEAGYGKLIPVLTKAIQELSNELQSIKAELTAIKGA